MALSPNHWSQELKADIKLVAETVVPIISVSITLYLVCRNCRGSNRTHLANGPTPTMQTDLERGNHEIPNEDPAQTPTTMQTDLETGNHEIPNEDPAQTPSEIEPVPGKESGEYKECDDENGQAKNYV